MTAAYPTTPLSLLCACVTIGSRERPEKCRFGGDARPKTPLSLRRFVPAHTEGAGRLRAQARARDRMRQTLGDRFPHQAVDRGHYPLQRQHRTGCEPPGVSCPGTHGTPPGPVRFLKAARTPATS